MIPLLTELRRRHVFRVGAAYVTVALGVLYAADAILGILQLERVLPVVLVVLALGLPLALVLAWAHEVRPKESATTGSEPAADRTPESDGHPFLSDPSSVAVLPFATLGSDNEDEYFADGVTEEIINALGNLPGLRVIARTSAFAFKGTHVDVREIGRQLGVGRILEGTVRRSDRRLRVTVQLVDVDGGHHLWSERYDRELEDVFAIQDEIATMIVRRLQPKADPLAERDRPTESLAAYEALLRGRFHYAKATYEGFARSVAEYERAISLDPKLAEAHAGLGATLYYWGLMTGTEATRDRALAAAGRAVELNPRLAEAHASLGLISCFSEWDWEASFQSMERALALNAGSAAARTGYATVLGNLGIAGPGVAQARRAVQLDPLSSMANHTLAFCLWVGGEFDEAVEYDDRALELAPDFIYAHGVRAMALMESGHVEQAVESLSTFLADSPEIVLARSVLVDALVRLDRREEALRELERIRRHADDPDGASRQSMAQAHAALGNVDEALHWIRLGVEARDSFAIGLGSYRWWDPLRSELAFQEIIEKMGYPDEARIADLFADT